MQGSRVTRRAEAGILPSGYLVLTLPLPEDIADRTTSNRLLGSVAGFGFRV